MWGHFNAPVNISTAGVPVSTQTLIMEKNTTLLGSIKKTYQSYTPREEYRNITFLHSIDLKFIMVNLISKLSVSVVFLAVKRVN